MRHGHLTFVARSQSLGFCLFAVAAGVGPFIDADSYRGRAWDSVRNVVPLWAWGVGFLLSAFLTAWGAIRDKPQTFIAGRILLFAFTLAWMVSIWWAAFLGDTNVTPTILGLWMSWAVIQATGMFAYERWLDKDAG